MDPFSLKDTLTGLDLRWSDKLEQRLIGITGPDIWRRASQFVTLSTARDVWLKWNPKQNRRIEDPRFLKLFREFLIYAVELGYRLDRFREVSNRLPDPDNGAKNWIPFFEEIVSADDCCTLRLFLSQEQQEVFQNSNHRPSQQGEWEKLLSMMADGLFYELGLVFRPIKVSVDNTLSSPLFRCEWNDLHLPPQRGLDNQSLLVNDTVDKLELLNIKGEEAFNPANGLQCAMINKAYRAAAEQAGLRTWDSREYAVLSLSAIIRSAAPALFNRSLYQLFILRLQEFSPDLVSVLEGVLPPDFVIRVMRGLLAEEISVRDLSTVLGGALELRSTVKIDSGRYIVFLPTTGGILPDATGRPISDLVPSDYVEFVRARLRRYISNKYTRGSNTLVVYLMDHRSEELIANPDGLDAGAEASIKSAIREEIDSLPATATTPVLLTSTEVRRRLHELVSPEFPHLAVLSYQELSPDINIQPIARITPDLGDSKSALKRDHERS
jgi:type III secretory pathway component EscV